MKTCPNCGEILGTHADTCFKCKYDFEAGKVLTAEERLQREQAIEEQRILEEKEEQERIERKQREEQELEEKLREYERKRKEREEQAEKEKLEFVSKLPLYEYATEVISDNRSGGMNVTLLNEVLQRYAKNGWRLHTAISNELGKNSTTIGLGGISAGVNATMDQTVLIFERMISKGSL